MAWIGKDWQIGEFVSERKIDPRLAQDWHGLARIGTDWHGLANWTICVPRKNWHQIGTDWQIGKFVSEPKIDPPLAQDWHGLAWIGMDWHGLARIGTDWLGLAYW